MKKLKAYLFIISFCFLTSWYLQAQQTEDFLSYAFKLQEEQRPEEALQIFNRVIYFLPDTSLLGLEARYGAANCYLLMNEPYKAQEHLKKVVKSKGASDSLRHEAYLKEIASYIMINDQAYAILELNKFPDTLSSRFLRKKQLYKAVAHYQLGDFNTSKEHFLLLANESSTAVKDSIITIFQELEDVSRLKPKLAKNLSRFIPGLGQLYGGDIKNGLNSFLLNTGLITAGVYLSYQYTVIDGILFVLPWFLRYYKGGQYKAALIVEERKTNSYNNSLKKLLNLFDNS